MFFFLYCGFVQLRNFFLKLKKRSLITVLLYHRVSDQAPYALVVSKENFQRQMQFLRRRYDVISVADLLRIIEQKENNGRKIAITFDDGWVDNYHNALSLL